MNTKRYENVVQTISCSNISLTSNDFFKGTVSVMLSELPCKDDNARFTTVPSILIWSKL